MTTFDIDRATVIRRAAVRATRAPSVHNTQPWRFVQRDGTLEVRADWERQLRVLDPTGRQLLLSCGCAIFNARVAFAAAGVPVIVDRFPDVLRKNLVARITPSTATCGPYVVDAAIAHLDAAIDVRQSNRRRFDDEYVSPETIEALIAAARAEGADLFSIRRPEHRAAVARLTQLADRIENAEPAYRAELRRWTTDDAGRVDGVPPTALPQADGTASDQCLLLLGTNADSPGAWARAGEALERAWLEIAHRGFTASPVTQVIEVARTREALRAELGLSMVPHVLLRVGRAQPTSATRRRRLVDVLVDGE